MKRRDAIKVMGIGAAALTTLDGKVLANTTPSSEVTKYFPIRSKQRAWKVTLTHPDARAFSNEEDNLVVLPNFAPNPTLGKYDIAEFMASHQICWRAFKDCEICESRFNEFDHRHWACEDRDWHCCGRSNFFGCEGYSVEIVSLPLVVGGKNGAKTPFTYQ